MNLKLSVCCIPTGGFNSRWCSEASGGEQSGMQKTGTILIKSRFTRKQSLKVLVVFFGRIPNTNGYFNGISFLFLGLGFFDFFPLYFGVSLGDTTATSFI